MSPRIDDEEDWGREDFDDHEDEDEDDIAEDEDDEAATIPCPYCQRPLHEDAQRCPSCEQYISREDQPPTRQPWWIILVVLVCLLLVVLWIIG